MTRREEERIGGLRFIWIFRAISEVVPMGLLEITEAAWLETSVRLSGEEFDNTGFWPTDDGFLSFEEDRPLKELFVFDQNIHDCVWVVDEVLWI